MANTFIVVPCYNEAQRFPVDRFRDFLKLHPEISYVLVNDGSRDQTTAVLENVREGFASRVHIIDRKENLGKGESVREGLLFAIGLGQAQIAGFWDADLATPLEAIFDMLPVLEKQPAIQMIFGARVNLLGRHIKRQAIRHYLGRVFATAVHAVIGLAVYDTQCGAKLFRVAPHLTEICREPFASRWVFDVEMIARWIRLNQYDRARIDGTIYEYPLYVWHDIVGSKVKPKDFFRAFIDLISIYQRYFAGRR